MISTSRPPWGWTSTLLFLLVLGGCHHQTRSDPSESATTPAVAAGTLAGEPADMPTPTDVDRPHPEDMHDPAHPPIDCPLRKQGIDPSKLRPFDDVEKYIAFLERPDRTAWQQPDTVVAALGLQGNETVVDLGAGSGYFSFRLARVLTRGMVLAADIEPEMVRHIYHKAMTEELTNLEARLIKPAEPAAAIPREADMVFICDVLHHVTDRGAWLAGIADAMHSGARLVLIEFKEGDLPKGPPSSVKIPHAELVKLVTGAGLSLTQDRQDLLPYQTFLVFTKP